MGANTATVAIVDGGETRTLASLRVHCVCYWWAAGDYGYSQRLSVVYGSEGRCCEDKDPTCEYTTTPSAFMFISILSLCMEIYALWCWNLIQLLVDFHQSLKVVYLPLEQAKRGLVKKKKATNTHIALPGFALPLAKMIFPLPYEEPTLWIKATLRSSVSRSWNSC